MIFGVRIDEVRNIYGLLRGGKNGAFNRDAMSVLRNRRILLFPDLGATDYWNSKMEMIRSLGIEVASCEPAQEKADKKDHRIRFVILFSGLQCLT